MRLGDLSEVQPDLTLLRWLEVATDPGPEDYAQVHTVGPGGPLRRSPA